MPALDQHRQAIKDEFIANRGYWTPLWDSVLEISPEYFEAYMKLDGSIICLSGQVAGAGRA